MKTRRLLCLLVAVSVLAGAAHLVAGPARAREPGQWTPMSDMAIARSRQAAVVLDAPDCHQATKPSWCGKVLVIGGDVGGNFDPTTFVTGTATASVELFDPFAGESGAWSSCPGDPPPSATCPAPMAQRRQNPVAAVLEDGRVLVVGGLVGVTGTVATKAEIYRPSTGQWTAAAAPADNEGTLIVEFSAATRLDGVPCAVLPRPSWCGKVLAIHRLNAQLYDPAADSWTTVVPPKRDHGSTMTATPLEDGRLVVVGGSGGPEVYDPNTGAWTDTGALTFSRSGHTATRLLDGKVLVAGGGNPRSELYDPATNAWALTPGSLSANRTGPESASLSDGSVLVAGGETIDPITGAIDDTSLVEVYDPASGRWEEVTPLGTARRLHALVRLPSHQVLAIGGTRRGPGNLQSVESYTNTQGGPTDPVPPVINSITPARAATSLKESPAFAEVTIAGTGFAGVSTVQFGGVLAAFHVDPEIPDNRLIARVPARETPGVVGVVVTTRPKGASAPASFEYVAPSGGVWEIGDELDEARIMHTETVLSDGTVLVAGGLMPVGEQPTNTRALATAERYDPKVVDGSGEERTVGRWAAAGSMTLARFGHAATLLRDGRVLVTGGSTDPAVLFGYDNFVPIAVAPLLDAELWTGVGTPADPGIWTRAASMAAGRTLHTATLLNPPFCEGSQTGTYPCGQVLVVGGDVTGTAERYDPRTGSWAAAGTLPSGPIRRHTATLLPDGRVLIVGGLDTANETVTKVAQLYDPVTDDWTRTAELSVARARHTATLLSNGRVLVTGGGSLATAFPGQPDNDKLDALATVELYDPNTGKWTDELPPMAVPRQWHTATPLPDGRVLVVGGATSEGAPGGLPLVVAEAELFDVDANAFFPAPTLTAGARALHTAALLPAGPASGCGLGCGTLLLVGGKDIHRERADSRLFFNTPRVTQAITPASGPVLGGTAVTIRGTGLAGVAHPDGGVDFGLGDTRARSVTVVSDNEVIAVSPRHAVGPVEVQVRTPAGTVAAGQFLFHAVDGLSSLVAEAVDEYTVRLSFLNPTDPPATRFLVRQSRTPIATLAAFEAATELCPQGGCVFPVAEQLTLTVSDLVPNTTYHYAFRALDSSGAPGPLSNDASVTTLACRAVQAAAGQVLYPRGYSLVGLPGGTMTGSKSPLYGWFDRNEGTYSVTANTQPAEGGRGYWAFFFCPTAVSVAAGDPTSLTLPLGAFHASMIGNPSTGPVTVRGHDYLARWNPVANDGEGAYVMSGYREPVTLAVGEGAWVFSYVATSIVISPA
jgi:hypothetical protein